MRQQCTHLDRIETAVTPNSGGCERCLELGDAWVELRICRTCGHVGCCDSSNNKHAERHFVATGHPIVKSYEPGEYWSWCFVDRTFLDVQ